MFVADGSNHRVQVFQPDGAFISQFGSFGTGVGQFGSISEIALGPDDSVYLLDDSLNALSKFTQEGKFLWRLEAGKVNIPGPLHTPVVRPDGRVQITCEGCHGDQIIDAGTGAIVDKYVIQFVDPDNSGTFDSAGNFYVATQSSMAAADDLVFDQNGALIGDRHGSGSSVGKAHQERGSAFFPAPVFGPDGLAYSFNEDGLLQIQVTLAGR